MTINPSAYILTVNAGSSSIKVALFDVHAPAKKVCEAAIHNIGQPKASLTAAQGVTLVAAATFADAANLLVDWLGTQAVFSAVRAVGHRIVHGGPHYHQTVLATDETLMELRKLAAFDPEHLPNELELVGLFKHVLPQAKHVLCFDTAFHHKLPTPARILPLPRRFEAAGVRRYGFHGLSYAYIVRELKRVEGEAAARGKVILAHLGSGASLAALHLAKPIDTTMSMTPASGIPMSTRSGDIDPGLALYFAQTQGYDARRFHHMVHFESGLLGMSETTADMEKLLEIEDQDPRAKDAIDMFCYQVKKNIGGFAAALGGLNTLVFTGGMGENAPKIRAKVCEDLEFLGITMDNVRNQNGARLISADGSAVGVHVIHTDEAVTIARETMRHIGNIT